MPRPDHAARLAVRSLVVSLALALLLPARALCEEIVTIPFDAASKTILVPATLNGKLKVTFVLDTGATNSTIDPRTVRSLGIAAAEFPLEVLVEGVNSSRELPLVEIERVSVGAATVTNFLAIVDDETPGKGAVGLLGMDFIKYFKHEIDPDEGLLKITARQAGTGKARALLRANDDALERKERTRLIDRKVGEALAELREKIAEVEGGKVQAQALAEFRKECVARAEREMTAITNSDDPYIQDPAYGGSRGILKAETEGLLDSVKTTAGAATQTAKKAVNETTRQLLHDLVDAQARVLVVAAREHETLGDLAGAYRLLCHAMRYGKGDSAREAEKEVRKVKFRCERLTKKIRTDLERERIEAAIKGLRAIVGRYPGTPMATDARRLFSRYRRSPKTAPAILYAEAFMTEEDGRPEEARKQYRELMKRYPTSLPALRARKRLRGLGTD